MSPNLTIQFLGAAGTVTGSKYLLRAGEKNLLIDCGMFQGLKKLRLLNWNHMPIPPSEIDCVLLTHGHLDHSGYLPRLVDKGFQGPIYGSEPTLEVAEIILKDSGKIQEEEAERANKEGYSKHKPAIALYTVEDAQKAAKQFRPVQEGEWIELFPNARARFQYNGHIIGASFVELEIDGKTLVFSGDIGRTNDLLMYAPKRPEKADYLLIESTYGDRIHPDEDLKHKLHTICQTTFSQGGTLIIPSFAVERAQTLMYLLWELKKEKQIGNVEMILDSPMGSNVLKVFERNIKWHRMTAPECQKMISEFRIVESYKETKEIVASTNPKIVIAGSGMLTGGRVLSYLEDYISLPSTTILLAGYQAQGTRGRRLREGAREIKLYGKWLPVKARIECIDSLSAHADQKELIEWLSALRGNPKKIFIVHGEEDSADTLRVKIKDTYHWETHIPSLDEIQELP